MLTALEVVREYTQAFAARDVERMIALAEPDIEIVTPRGTGRGHQEIRDFVWFELPVREPGDGEGEPG